MDKLIKDIDEARNISDGTLKVYETNLRNIHKAVEGEIPHQLAMKPTSSYDGGIVEAG